MLQIDKVRVIEGITVYDDHEAINVFYPLANQLRYLQYPDGTYAFKLMKYRSPIDRPNGVKGGFIIFDVEFVVPEDKKARIKEALASVVAQRAREANISPVPEVVLGNITYTKGTTMLHYPQLGDSDDGKKLHNPGKPSLYGNNVASFAIELSQDEATLFEQAMQGRGGAVGVVYDLWMWARLPEITAHGQFNASAFYSFYQEIDTEWHLWAEDEYRETISELMVKNQVTELTFDWGGLTDQKIISNIRDWVQRSLEDAVENAMIDAIAPVPEDQRKKPDGIEDVTRNITNTQISNVYIDFKENQTVEWNIAPQGILQNITSLPGVNWNDYFVEIDLNDKFFEELRVNVYVNADFENLPIHSVEVKVLYDGRPMPNLAEGEAEGEVILNSPDSIGRFATYVKDDNWNYTYSYQINYRGESQIYQSPEIETNEGNLTIGVDDVGILDVEFASGDINWNEVDRVAVHFKYEDRRDNIREEDQFSLTQAQPTYHIQRVIFQPMRENYTYSLKYHMKDGQEFHGSQDKEARSPKLFINDVFSGRKTLQLQGVGDFTTRINNIFIDIAYKDTDNQYRLEQTFVLNASTPFHKWTFPVINANAGQVTYQATVAYRDGTNDMIPETIAEGNTILFPPPTDAFLEVLLVPDLIDWELVRLVRAAMRYEDSGHNLVVNVDFIFSVDKSAPITWQVPLKDASKDDYSYLITYYLTQGGKKDVSGTGEERTLILDPQV